MASSPSVPSSQEPATSLRPFADNTHHRGPPEASLRQAGGQAQRRQRKRNPPAARRPPGDVGIAALLSLILLFFGGRSGGIVIEDVLDDFPRSAGLFPPDGAIKYTDKAGTAILDIPIDRDPLGIYITTNEGRQFSRVINIMDSLNDGDTRWYMQYTMKSRNQRALTIEISVKASPGKGRNETESDLLGRKPLE